MEKKKAYELSIECISEKAKSLKEYYMRYKSNPKMWKELKSKHDRYVEYVEAIKYLQDTIDQVNTIIIV
jgi:hypothetical protein